MRVILSLFCFVVMSAQAEATITYRGVTNVSALDITTAPSTPMVFGAYVVNGSDPVCQSSTQVCDSCQGNLNSCSKVGINPNLVANFVIQSSATNITASDIISRGTSDAEIPRQTPTISSDGNITVPIKWADLCNAAGMGTSCTGNLDGGTGVGFGSFELKIGTSVSGGTADTMTFRIRIKTVDVSVDQINTYQECTPATGTTEAQPGRANDGFCYFSAYPGDGKIYADQLGVPSGYPAAEGSSIEYTQVLFFYEPAQTGENENNDATILSRVTNKSPMKRIAVNRTAKPPTSDNRIDGLMNEVRYCMRMASEDQTSMITHFSPDSTTTEFCATPSKVVGLLDDKNCFIATAAFGSQMAPEVQSFRDFRNRFLLSNSVGKAFVKFYYKYSPYYANLIAESEVAKSVVRGFLWPLLLFARLSVAWGLFATLLLVAFAGLGGFVALRYLRLRYQQSVRGEA